MFKKDGLTARLLILFTALNSSFTFAAKGETFGGPLEHLLKLEKDRVEKARQQATERTRQLESFVEQSESKQLTAKQTNLAYNYFYERALHVLSTGSSGQAQLIWTHVEGRSGVSSLMEWIARFESNVKYEHVHLTGNEAWGTEEILERAQGTKVLVLDDFSFAPGRDERLLLQLKEIGGDRVVVIVDSSKILSRINLSSYSRLVVIDDLPQSNCQSKLLN